MALENRIKLALPGGFHRGMIDSSSVSRCSWIDERSTAPVFLKTQKTSWRNLMEPIGRLFLCASCRKQTVICSACDRGQIYCSSACSEPIRRSRVRDAGRRYQSSEPGRANHAQRMKRYRENRAQVTHQGPIFDPDDVVSSAPVVEHVTPAPRADTQTISSPWRCQACKCTCSAFVRLGFLYVRPALQIVQRARAGRSTGRRTDGRGDSSRAKAR